MTRSPGTVASADPLSRVAALPGVEEAATAARAAVDTLLRHRILRRRSAEVTAEASLRAARASAALEGHEVPLEELRAYLAREAEEPSGSPAPADPALATTLGAVRLYGELGMLTSAWERAPRQALARMHVLAGRGLLPDEALGRPRSGPSAGGVNGLAGPAGAAVQADPLGLGPAPEPMEMTARLDGLTSILLAPTSAPAVVVAAVVHGELLAIRPFGALDGLIARAAARLVLTSRGLDPKALTATDVGHIEAGRPQVGSEASGGETDAPAPAGAAYREAIAAYIEGGPEGVATWVRHCARALELAARESLAICEALSRS